MSSFHKGSTRLLAGGAMAALLAVSGAGAALAAGEEDPNAKDSGGAIMVWLDPPREAAAAPFMEAYPDIPFEWNPVK